MAFSFALFRHNQSFTLALLIIVILFLWIPTFIYPISIEYNGMPLYSIINWSTFNSPYFTSIVAFIIIIIQGIYINLWVNRHDLIINSSYLPSLLYIILASLLPEFRTLSPTLIASIFILLACDSLLSMYKQKYVDNLVFNASFLIAIASLFSFQAVFFYCIVIVALIIFRPFSWREWMISVCGFLVPYIFIFTWMILTNKEINVITECFSSIDTLFVSTNVLIRNTVGCLIFILIIISYLKISKYLNSTSVKIKKGYLLMNWLIVISLISFLIFHLDGNSRFIYLSIPFSIFLSNYFLLSPKSFIAEVLFILFLLTTIFVQINYLCPII
ncbi:MAG: hypothetical protein A3K10_06070 [Bacteroidetes bacterium RIFCSPLOWO2_12_FULL_31_6]|nr:MAG: hypothetical protein A3K10_06070 [Bacteroidetes bacterium RIFCSPLOWO2_12_FULL_31_6]